MNNGYRIYWLWVILSVPSYYAGAMLFKHEMKGIGEWLFLFSSCSLIYGIAGSLVRGEIWSRAQPSEPTNVTHTHNHYYYDSRSNVVEGTEVVNTRNDGSSTTTRHIKKWN